MNITAKNYAKILGITLLIVAVVGFVIGDEPLLGVLNIDLQEDLIHLFSGGLLAFVGFTRSEKVATLVVGALGAIYLTVGIMGVVFPNLFGFLQHDYSALDNSIHLTLGVLGLVIYFKSRSKQQTSL